MNNHSLDQGPPRRELKFLGGIYDLGHESTSELLHAPDNFLSRTIHQTTLCHYASLNRTIVYRVITLTTTLPPRVSRIATPRSAYRTHLQDDKETSRSQTSPSTSLSLESTIAKKQKASDNVKRRRRLGRRRRKERPGQDGRTSTTMGIRPRARRKTEHEAE